MQTACTTGLTSRTTREGPSGNQPDDGDCVVCGDDADGIDARTRQPICRRCASIRCDGGEPVAATGGGRHAPAMDGSTTPERTYAHYCDEVGSTVYAPRRKCPLECYRDDDVDRGDSIETDGGVTVYDCPECGEIEKCNVDDAGQRRCPDCGRAVTAVVTDGGPELVMGRHSRIEECSCGATVIGYLDGDPCPDCGEVIYS